jgi:hypothetical protein
MKMNDPKLLTPGEYQLERYRDPFGRPMVQYDYRNLSGILFSCVRKTEIECIAACDKWCETNGR